MAETPEEFLDIWVRSYVHVWPLHLDQMDQVMEDLDRDAARYGFDISDLDTATGGSVRSHVEAIIRRLYHSH